MADDKMNINGFGAGFMADMLRDLQKQYEIDKKPKEKGKRGKTAKKSVQPKGKDKGLTAMPAGKDAKGTAMPAEQAKQSAVKQGAVAPGIHMMPVTDEANPRPGNMLLDTYRVESDAMKGGMGAVWRVHHTGWDVDLAMKRPHPEAFRTEAQKKNFTDECKYWMDLGLHPNIVSCYYVREIGGIPTIFSEWMENGSLESHIKDGTLYRGTKEQVQERLLDIAIQFARGLHYAHENDLIHQDVKPDNLLLTEGWTAKVSDFGLAKARTMLTFLGGTATELEYDTDATMVTPGGGMTPAYCSPEQAARQQLTRRTDIYSWAVSVLEMYLGDKPWAHGRELTGPLVGSVCRDYFDMCVERPMPKELQELLAYCLEQDSDDRPHDFGKVEAELHKIYKTETGANYPRPEPKAAADTADSLNNRALSYLDLGKPEEAEALWETAMKADMHNLHTIYNQGLWQWRKGEITDEELLYRLLHAKSDQKEAGFRSMMAHIHLERGDGAAALSFLSEDGDEKFRETARRLSASKAQYEGGFLPFPLSEYEILDVALIPKLGKCILQVRITDDLMRFVLWDPKGEEGPCILDEWRPERTSYLLRTDFAVDVSGNYAVARFGRYGDGEHKFVVWDLSEVREYRSYDVPAWGERERHIISPDGRWLAVTWHVMLFRRPGSQEHFYCIHEDGSVSQDKAGSKTRKCESVTYLFELHSDDTPHVFYTPWAAEWPMFSQDNKLLVEMSDELVRTIISIEPSSLQCVKRCLAEGEPAWERDTGYIPVQPPRDYDLQSSALSPDGKIMVRRFRRTDYFTSDPNLKLQFVQMPAGRCMATFDAGSYNNYVGDSVFTSDGKGVFSPGEAPIIRAVPQWIYHAPMIPSFTASIGSTSLAFETEREYEDLIQAGERHFAQGSLTEALACVDRAWSLREPDERLIALNRRLGQTCVAVGIRSLRKVGTFPHYHGEHYNEEEAPLFDRDGKSFVTRTDITSWQKFDVKTLRSVSPEVGFTERNIWYNPCATLTPDGRFLYADYNKPMLDFNADPQYGIKKFDLVTGQATEVFAEGIFYFGAPLLGPDDYLLYYYGAPLLSPDGNILYCVCLGKCHAFPTPMPGSAGKFSMEIPKREGRNPDAPNYVQKLLSTDGRRMFCAAPYGALWAFDIRDTPQKLFEADHSKEPLRMAALSPDDKSLCILRKNGRIELLDAGDGEILHIFPAWEQAPVEKYKDASIVFSPDGNLLLLFLEELIVIYDLKNRVVRGSFLMYDWVGNAAFAPDGRMFATSPVSDGMIYEVDYLYCAPDDFSE